MRLVAILKEHLDALKDAGVLEETVYCYPAQFNNMAGRLKTPVGLLITPDSWELDIDTAIARENGYFNVYFLTAQDELDFDATANEVLIDAMIDAATQYLAALKSDRRIELLATEVAGTSVYDANNKNLTGCRIRIRVKELQGRCIEPLNRC